MSDKCDHNNHTHFMIWICLWVCWLNACGLADCSGTAAKVRDLENRVYRIEHK